MKQYWIALLWFAGAITVPAQSPATPTPGSVVVSGPGLFITSTGCLSFLNEGNGKKSYCSFKLIVPGITLTKPVVNALVTTNADGSHDTVFNVTYAKAVLQPDYTDLSTVPGTMVILVAAQDGTQVSNGCFAGLNMPVLHCGFNVNLIGVALPNIDCTPSNNKGNAVLNCTYDITRFD